MLQKFGSNHLEIMQKHIAFQKENLQYNDLAEVTQVRFFQKFLDMDGPDDFSRFRALRRPKHQSQLFYLMGKIIYYYLNSRNSFGQPISNTLSLITRETKREKRDLRILKLVAKTFEQNDNSSNEIFCYHCCCSLTFDTLLPI